MPTTNQFIIILIAAILSLFLGFGVATAFITPTHADYDYFMKICNVPFNLTPEEATPDVFWSRNYGDCNDRALAFRTYLLNKGYTNVKTCWVCRLNENGNRIPIYDGVSYAHAFIVWNNKVYNPSVNVDSRFYNADIDDYQKFLRNKGYNTWYWENQTVGTPF